MPDEEGTVAGRRGTARPAIVVEGKREGAMRRSRAWGSRLGWTGGLAAVVAMLLAAMCAEGPSTIHSAAQIERGYERIDERLNALGAHITRVPARA